MEKPPDLGRARWRGWLLPLGPLHRCSEYQPQREALPSSAVATRLEVERLDRSSELRS